MSDLYYGWCNQVIEGVLKQYPHKWFGCLAYSEVAQPPRTVRVHERLIPYMTYDRMKWADDALRAEGERMTRQWRKASPVLGWYDYIYGTPYCAPRVWFHDMADYCRFARDNGVRAHYAEAYPNWGEGPKLWVALKLQWNPDADPDALLREWYERAVGQAAAVDLAAYYAHWEDFWTRRVLNSAWFTRRGQYLPFNQCAYLSDITEQEMRQSRRWLESTVAKAVTPKQKARANLLLKAFEYYEATWYAWQGDRQGAAMPLESEADALRLADGAAQGLAMARKRLEWVRQFAEHPVLRHPLPPDRYPALAGTEWGANTLYRLAPWVARSEAVRSKLEQLVSGAADGAAKRAMDIVLMLADPKNARPVSKNPSFEAGQGGLAAEWSNWVKWQKGALTRCAEAARTGESGMKADGVLRGGPNQVIPAAPGVYRATAYVRVPKATKGKGAIELHMTCRDARGRNLTSYSALEEPRPGDWRQITLIAEIPAKVKDKPVASILLLVLLQGFEPGDVVHIDDVVMERVEAGP